MCRSVAELRYWDSLNSFAPPPLPDRSCKENDQRHDRFRLSGGETHHTSMIFAMSSEHIGNFELIAEQQRFTKTNHIY
jgi:hypothetical protein